MGLVEGKGILTHKQVVLAIKKISLGRPEGNPGYLSNRFPQAQSFSSMDNSKYLRKRHGKFSLMRIRSHIRKQYKH